MWLSGLTIELWLGRRVAPPVALAAGIALILALYHVLDQYWRGAFAEFAAIAMLPLLFAALEAACRGWRGVPCLGLAGVICAHLPLAVLACVSVVSAILCASVPAWRPAAVGDVVARTGLRATLGLGLAAAYILPATLLQPHASIPVANAALTEARMCEIIRRDNEAYLERNPINLAHIQHR